MRIYNIIEKQLEAYREKLPQAEKKWPFRVQNVYICLIKNLFDSPLSVTWMKSKCRINGHNFAPKFRYYIGKNPNAFINHHRIEAAKLLLANDRLKECTVSGVATEVGFSSISAFSKCFKRQTGKSPSSWRKKHLTAARRE